MKRTKHPILTVAGRSALPTTGSLARVVAAACLTLSTTGCGLTAQDIRLPTRSGSVNLSNDPGNPTDIPHDTTTPSSCVAPGAAGDANRLRMQQLVSEYRQQNNLNAMGYSITLERAANDFALRMYREGFFDHEDPDGNQPGDRAMAAGFCDVFVGENIAYGLNQMSSAEEVMTGFKNSPSHRENMLRKRWDHIGVGYLHITSPQGEEFWWVQLFGTDSNAD